MDATPERDTSAAPTSRCCYRCCQCRGCSSFCILVPAAAKQRRCSAGHHAAVTHKLSAVCLSLSVDVDWQPTIAAIYAPCAADSAVSSGNENTRRSHHRTPSSQHSATTTNIRRGWRAAQFYCAATSDSTAARVLRDATASSPTAAGRASSPRVCAGICSSPPTRW